MDGDRRGHAHGMDGRAAARVAAGLAFLSAATSLYWLLGGTALLDTVGGGIEDLARERSAVALTGLAVVVVLKLVAGLLALSLVGLDGKRLPDLIRIRLGWLVALVLTLYGSTLVLVGLAVLIVDPGAADDPYALRWHVFFWDLWFALWGIAHVLALRRGVTPTRGRSSPRSRRPGR